LTPFALQATTFAVKPQELLTFLRRHKFGVVATVASDGSPEAAVVGVATTDQLEIVFDTLTSTHKYANLTREPRVALVVGWETATAQIHTIADEPTGAELERLKQCYFEAFPDGPTRLSWPGITYIRLRPTWARFSDFSVDPPNVVEFEKSEIENFVK
jgi:general stress protein 26